MATVDVPPAEAVFPIATAPDPAALAPATEASPLPMATLFAPEALAPATAEPFDAPIAIAP